ncbi:hypothetical protein H072_11403 [Dactylellina haptotyla CBS 200.50]|uniref:Protein kinase domain-containing protein n=1 Tax=Dactylellina haptotyla (strain CBS 200.50) TaxID=1284197 RepID=S7ZXN9_DACHA|nr:hypothetical protein H072_11403 [Dactylellina haptotyla CBS 200.50]
MAEVNELTPDSSWSIPDAPVFTPSTSNAVIISNPFRDPSEQDVSQRMLQLGKAMNIIGPKLISRERYEAESLGRGAKFEFFGHKLPAELEDGDGMLWEGIDIRRIAFKRGRTSLKKPEELDDPSSSWVAVVSESQENIGDIRNDDQKAKQLEQVAAVVREMKALARNNLRDHRNIVKLFAWGFDMEDFNSQSLMTPILVEERAWGTFNELLVTGRLTAAERFNLSHDALQGLVALHRDGLYHGDINPKNILVYQEEENIIAKISDFSHCGFLPTESGDMIWYQGTKGWQAPEISDSLPTSKLDILALEAYSFGLVLWSALGLSGKSPLLGAPEDKTAIPRFAHRCIESYSLPIEIQNIVVPIIPRLLHHEPNTRFWLSQDILENKVELPGRRLVLQTSAPPTALSMDQSFRQLDEFLYRTQKQQMPQLPIAPPLIPTIKNPFLKLLIEEAYARNVALRLAAIPELPAYGIPAFKVNPLAYHPPEATQLRQQSQMSLHRLEQIDRERQSGVFKSLTAETLFDMAIGFYSFDTSRGLLYLRQAAAAGDVRAQALYGGLSRSAQQNSGPIVPSDTLQQWEFDAMATGFTLLSKPSNPLATQLAVTQFRENAGYNSYQYLAKGIRNVQSFHIDLQAMRDHLQISKDQAYTGQLPVDGFDRNTILHFAALAGDVETTQVIVDKLAERPWYLNTLNFYNETPIIMACRAGNADITRILLNGGASANTRDGRQSPLHWLFALPTESMKEICELLVSKGKARLAAIAEETAMVHFPFCMPEGTPLVWAVAAGSLPAVEAIATTIVQQTELSVIEKQKCFEGAIKLAMVRHEADIIKTIIDTASSHAISLASVASEAFDWTVVSVPEDSEDIPITATPLVGDWKDGVIRIFRHGSQNQNLRRTLLYLNSLQSSRLSEGDEQGTTPNIASSFMYLKQVIIQHDSVATLRLLQRYGPSYLKSDLGTALFINLQHNWATPSSERFPAFMDIFRGLVSAGADVNMPNPLREGLGNTLIHIIIRKYSDQKTNSRIQETREVVILLLKVLQSCGVDINKKNLVGMTVMDYAIHNNRNFQLDDELVDMLHNWGSRSTFRLLPMNVEDRIGNWASRQLEWQQPEPERVDIRHTGGNLGILWTEIAATRVDAPSEDEDNQMDEFYDIDSDGEDGTVVDGDDVSVLSQADTLA